MLLCFCAPLRARQNLILESLRGAGKISGDDTHSERDASGGWSNFVVCLEMLGFALAHHFVFSYTVSGCGSWGVCPPAIIAMGQRTRSFFPWTWLIEPRWLPVYCVCVHSSSNGRSLAPSPSPSSWP